MDNVRRMLIAVFLVSLFIFPFAMRAEGQDTVRINCPLAYARTEVTTPLPAGWWNTPQEGQLIGTRVEAVGGEKTLVCAYWAYGMPKGVSIMHLFPEGMAVCRADKTGFTCYRTEPAKKPDPFTGKKPAGSTGRPQNTKKIGE